MGSIYIEDNLDILPPSIANKVFAISIKSKYKPTSLAYWAYKKVYNNDIPNCCTRKEEPGNWKKW